MNGNGWRGFVDLMVGNAKAFQQVVAISGTGPRGHWLLGEVIGRCQLVHPFISGMTSILALFEMEVAGIGK